MLGGASTPTISNQGAMAPGEKVMAKFTGVEVEDSGTLAFTFENNSGKLTHKVWNNYDIPADKLAAQGSKERELQDAGKELSARVLAHLGAALLKKETYDQCMGANFKAWADVLGRALNAEAKGTEVILHVILITNKKSGKQFVGLPKYPNFIKSEHLPESNWATDPRYHTYERVKVEQADAEAPVESDGPKLPF